MSCIKATLIVGCDWPECPVKGFTETKPNMTLHAFLTRHLWACDAADPTGPFTRHLCPAHAPSGFDALDAVEQDDPVLVDVPVVPG